jgi:anaerobic selenocysteine-containing dehydrogenase
LLRKYILTLLPALWFAPVQVAVVLPCGVNQYGNAFITIRALLALVLLLGNTPIFNGVRK